MRQALGPFVERGAGWLERRAVGSLGPRLRRLAYEPGREPVRIDDLISPLRYDILVRQSYFEFLRRHRGLADEDFETFVEMSRSLPFFRWFAGVAIPEFHRGWGGDEEAVRASFERRLRAVIAMYDDLESGGYDPRRPIVLRTGHEILPTKTGKRIATEIYAGDGCHRLAWLRLSGVTELEPGSYRLQRAAQFTPRDVTSLVLNAMTITSAEYFSFLSLAYADRVVQNEAALLEEVHANRPERLDELQHVLARDAPLLADRKGADL